MFKNYILKSNAKPNLNAALYSCSAVSCRPAGWHWWNNSLQHTAKIIKMQVMADFFFSIRSLVLAVRSALVMTRPSGKKVEASTTRTGHDN